MLIFSIFLVSWLLKSKKHTVNVYSITFSFLNQFKQKLYVALLDTELYMLSKTHVEIIAFRPSKVAPTFDVPFLGLYHLDN